MGEPLAYHTPSAGHPRALRSVVLILLFVALPIRLYVALQATMVSRDGVRFIWYAQALAQDPVQEIRRQAQHPLYPALILLAHHAWEAVHGVFPFIPADPVQGWAFAAVSVTLVGGLAVVLAVYALALALFDGRVAVLAAWLTALAAELCQLSGDALTDMPHLAVYLFGLTAGIHGVRAGRVAWLALAGLLGGVGFLIRPEGAGCAVITGLALMVFARSQPWRRRIAGLIVLGLAGAVVAGPYMYVTGKLVQKKSPGQLIGGEAMAAPPGPLAMVGVDAGRALVNVAAEYSRSLRVTYLLPLIAWCLYRRRLPPEPTAARMVSAAAALHLLILIGLILHFDYWKLFSMRHVMILTGLSLPFCAAGVRLLLDALLTNRSAHGFVRWGGTAVVLTLVLPTTPWMLERLHAENAHIRRAGDWIRGRQPTPPPRVLSTRYNAAFYANGVEARPLFDDTIASVLGGARKAKPDWVVLDEPRVLRVDPDYLHKLAAALRPGEVLELAHVACADKRYGERRALVYRYRPPS